MFFFFDLKDDVDKIVRYILSSYLIPKFKNVGYCDMTEMFEPNSSIISKAKKNNINIQKLYKSKAKDCSDFDVLPQIFNRYNMEYSYADSLTVTATQEDEIYSISAWIFGAFKKSKKENEKTVANFVEYASEILDVSLDCIGTVIYDTERVEAYEIDSIEKYLEALKKLDASRDKFFYRGHEKASYKLEPSVIRNPEIFANEKNIYQELIINCPKNFSTCESHIDYLVEMQHYGLPTRLLDITRNPLVALYFAASGNNSSNVGEVVVFNPSVTQIKFYNSDVVTILSSLPLFKKEEQDIIADYYFGKEEKLEIVDRFIYEIKTEKPAFENRIKRDDIGGCFIVLPKKDNERITKQDGAFIICGVLGNVSDKINSDLRLKRNNRNVLLCITNKKQILQELDLLSINKSTLFPEIDNVSEYICKKYTS